MPLLEILSSTYLLEPTLKSLRSRSIMFLSQLTSAHGDCLLLWTDLNDPDRPLTIRSRFSKQPFWHKKLEYTVLAHPLTSRQVKLQFSTGVNQNFIHYIRRPDLTRLGKKEWVSVWNDEIKQAIIGRI